MNTKYQLFHSRACASRQSGSVTSPNCWPRLAQLALLTGFAVLSGCQGPQPIRPDLAAAAIHVEARAKSGYHESAGDGYTKSDDPVNAGAFERVNYASLGDIVVWVEPQTPASAPHAPLNGRVTLTSRPNLNPPVVVVSVGGTLTIENQGALTEEVYSVSESQHLNTGALAPGAKVDIPLEHAGVIELLSAARSAPLATVFIAGTPWTQLAQSGQTVVFTDLPPGAATVHAWHPRLPAESIRVSLPAGGGATARVRVGVDALETP